MSVGDIGPGDLDFDLLPADPGLVSPDLALDAALAPVVDFATPAEQPLGKGWRFDFLTGQFVRRGGSPMEVYDVDNLAMWVEKTLRTARYAHAIYSSDYGMAEPYAPIGRPLDGATLASWQEEIQDSLLVHDRIVAVEDFRFNMAPLDDALNVSFTVVLDAAGQLNPQTLEFTDVPLGGAA
jgi:hypothetical protein